MKKRKEIILIGAGGHANSCIDVINSGSKYKVSFLVDISLNKKNKLNYRLKEEKLFKNKKLYNKNILISLGQLKNGKFREKKFNFYKKKKCIFPTIKSPYSIISKTSLIGEGTVIMHYVLINSNVIIGKNCIINSRATIEHDCIIEDNVHVAPGAIILGGTHIKKNSFIGSGAVVRQGALIKPGAIIPANTYYK